MDRKGVLVWSIGSCCNVPQMMSGNYGPPGVPSHPHIHIGDKFFPPYF